MKNSYVIAYMLCYYYYFVTWSSTLYNLLNFIVFDFKEVISIKTLYRTIIGVIFLLAVFSFFYNKIIVSNNNATAECSNLKATFENRNNLISDFESIEVYIKCDKNIFENINKAKETLINTLEIKDFDNIEKANSDLSSVLDNLFIVILKNFSDFTYSQTIQKFTK